jgi:hypothetical protein
MASTSTCNSILLTNDSFNSELILLQRTYFHTELTDYFSSENLQIRFSRIMNRFIEINDHHSLIFKQAFDHYTNIELTRQEYSKNNRERSNKMEPIRQQFKYMFADSFKLRDMRQLYQIRLISQKRKFSNKLKVKLLGTCKFNAINLPTRALLTIQSFM